MISIPLISGALESKLFPAHVANTVILTTFPVCYLFLHKVYKQLNGKVGKEQSHHQLEDGISLVKHNGLVVIHLHRNKKHIQCDHHNRSFAGILKYWNTGIVALKATGVLKSDLKIWQNFLEEALQHPKNMKQEENRSRIFVKGNNHPREYYAVPFYKVERQTTISMTSNLSNAFPKLQFS